ncbi:hypothetical protein [Paractinoplanes rishiriensis]|uniref:Gram-positive cocci surface proteins LPxTG domain-containing protein n=1 Tax=Paractinoplanes rishiriensis TaxID=1050105 RepID=A0A919JZI1_9ACTN|nr:hypothetical protein [Actinoplanes rishiriensis]GIE98101.1 hypothetical protein Ari01nite_55660 [Actinoplanes rishiriensis]
MPNLSLVRAGLTGLVTAGALCLTATPALAADIDFGLELSGTTIATDASGKWPKVKITNHGTTSASAVSVVFDTTQLDPAKVSASDVGGYCTTENGLITCDLDDYGTPAPGGSLHVLVPLVPVDGATGPAGKLTVTVRAEGDTVEANDSRTADVTISGHGADLSVYVQDLTWQNENGTITEEPVPPGKTSPLFALIVNQGDMVADGVRVRVQLPEQTSFTTRQYQGCSISADRRTANCELTQFSLNPRPAPGSTAGEFGMFFTFQVLVSPDARGPVALQGGKVTAEPIQQVSALSAAGRRNAELPDFVSWATPEQLSKIDPDPSDNTDTFVVFVGAGPDDGETPPGDGETPGDDDGGQGGSDGGLPVTGPGAVAVGGAGLAAVAVGALLLVITRRRRI